MSREAVEGRMIGAIVGLVDCQLATLLRFRACDVEIESSSSKVVEHPLKQLASAIESGGSIDSLA